MEILGNPELEVTLNSNQSRALIAVRLCDVWPDGRSTLITRGILNLCHRYGKGTPRELIPGEHFTVKVLLNHTGYSVPSGHRLRLAVSTSYWPIAWPSPCAATLKIANQSSCLHLPLRSPDASEGKLTQFKPVAAGEPLPTTQLRDFSQRRGVVTDPQTGEHKLEIISDNGKTRFDGSGMEMGSTSLQRYSIKPDDSLSAKAEYEWEWEFGRSDEWHIKTFARTEITCDVHYFNLNANIFAWEMGVEVFRKSWNEMYPRDHF